MPLGELVLSPSFVHHQCSCSSPHALWHTGMASVELLLSLQRRFAELRPLALVLKQLLSHQNLNNTYAGGVSSYCLVLMIVAFLLHFERSRDSTDQETKQRAMVCRHRPLTWCGDSAKPGREAKDGPGRLGVLLVEFLRWYSVDFDCATTGIVLDREQMAHEKSVYSCIR